MVKGKFRTKFERGGRKIFAIRNADGTFANIETETRALGKDVRQSAKTKVKSGQGFRGDRKIKK
ncbi:MAG: hypothetical protein NTW79_04260 [Candidatus Berkelbacteria bacterium]|nr:hypothetical protein [Candidatus Berkelbacteria bacterium]